MLLGVIDYETFYDNDYTLTKMTTESYIRDPRFQTIGVGITLPQMSTRYWLEHEEFKAFVARGLLQQLALVAHHAHFDGLISSHHYGFQPRYWLDTLSMANMIHGQTMAKSLAKLMVYYGVGEKGDEVVRAKGFRREDFLPEEWQRYGRYCLNDCDGTYGILVKMLPKINRNELDLIDITVRMFTEPTLVLDEPRMLTYLEAEKVRKSALMERIADQVIGDGGMVVTDREDAVRTVLMSGDKFAELLLDMGVTPQKKRTKKIDKDTGELRETWAFAKTDAFMKGLLESDDDEVRWAAEARVGVKSTINESRTARFLACGAGGRPMPVYIRYSAAHTHRWGGADKMNWQNLQRTSKKDPTAGTIRKSIRAPEGYLLSVADSSQIEARWTAKLAGHRELLDLFRMKKDVYSAFASKAYRRTIDRKNVADDEIPGQVGKVCVLGLGFGMGWYNLALEMLKGAQGGPPIQFLASDIESLGINPNKFLNNPKKVEMVALMPSRLSMDARLIHCIVCEHFVNVWRAENKPITELWKTMELALEFMLDSYHGERRIGHGGLITVGRHYLKLPSGNVLHYPGLQMEQDERGRPQYTYLGGRGGKERVKAYGGSVTENFVQAIARDTVAEQGIPIARRYKMAMMSHDEWVALMREAEAHAGHAWMLQQMTIAPAWAGDIPLAAEGGVGKIYGEIK